jgi:uncharacterized alpha-E superfamily protein
MLLSKVAERVYWMARYVERAENTARLIEANARMLLDLPVRVEEGWRPLVVVTGSGETFYEHHETADERAVCRWLISERNNPASILCCLTLARENARTLRDIMPRRAWEALNHLCLYASSELTGNLSRTRRNERLAEVINLAQAFAGALSGAMLHDDAYDFLRLGRQLERADMTTRIIDVRSVNLMFLPTDDTFVLEQAQWRSILAALSATTGYRRRKQSRMAQAQVLNFLIQDGAFPRSCRYCTGVIRRALQRLPRNRALVRECNAVITQLEEADLTRVGPESLHTFLDELQMALAALHGRIQSTYLQIGPD